MATCNFPNCQRHATDNGYCIGHKNYGNVVSKSKFKPIPKETITRAMENREYKKLIAVFLLNNPKCMVKDCKKKSTQVHHKAGRIGDKLTDVKDFFATCDDHHDHIEKHPKEAKKNGYSKSRLIKQA